MEYCLWNCGAVPAATDLLLLRRPAEAQGGQARGDQGGQQAGGEAGGETGDCHRILFNMAGDEGWTCV